MTIADKHGLHVLSKSIIAALGQLLCVILLKYRSTSVIVEEGHTNVNEHGTGHWDSGTLDQVKG